MDRASLMPFAWRPLRGKGPQGRQARRSAGAAADDLRAGHQPKDREALGLTVPQSLLQRADEVIE